MLKTAISHTGAKLDGFIGAGFVAAGTMAPEAWLEAHGSALMIGGGLLLLMIRIAIAIKQFFRE